MTDIQEKNRYLLILNLLLQLLDGSVSYGLFSLGGVEAGSSVNAAMESWRFLGGVLYYKALAGALLLSIYLLGSRREAMAANALTITASVYSCYTAAAVMRFWYC